MRILDFSTIGDLFKFHDTAEERDVLLSKIRSGRSFFFINDDNTAYVNYDSMFGGKWICHIECLPKVRGRELWDFCYSTAVWMIEKAGMKQQYNFVKRNDRKLRIFVKHFGIPMVARIGDEELYVADDKQILRFKEVVLCQQQYQ